MPNKPRIYWPVRPYVRNQAFGENVPCVIDFGLPTQKVIQPLADNTCPVGSDKLYAHFGMSGHNGTDLMAGEQNVYAALDGVVVEKQEVPARGLGLGILSNEKYNIVDTGSYFLKVRYWHLKTFFKEVGDTVKAGDLIGISDNTGYSNGNHLHFEGQPMQKDAGGHPYLAFGDGVFFGSQVIAGAIDLEPFFCGTYAEDLPRLISLNQTLINLLTRMVAALKSK